MRYRQQRAVTIASGQTTSGVINTGSYTAAGLHLTAALTGATVTFTGSPSETGSFQTVKDSDGSTVSVATATAGAIGFSGAELDALSAWPFIKVVSASSEAADRSLTLMLV